MRKTIRKRISHPNGLVWQIISKIILLLTINEEKTSPTHTKTAPRHRNPTKNAIETKTECPIVDGFMNNARHKDNVGKPCSVAHTSAHIYPWQTTGVFRFGARVELSGWRHSLPFRLTSIAHTHTHTSGDNCKVFVCTGHWFSRLLVNAMREWHKNNGKHMDRTLFEIVMDKCCSCGIVRYLDMAAI